MIGNLASNDLQVNAILFMHICWRQRQDPILLSINDRVVGPPTDRTLQSLFIWLTGSYY